MRFFAPRTTTNSFKTHSAWVPGSGLVQIAVSSMVRLDCPNSTQLYLRSSVDTALQIFQQLSSVSRTSTHLSVPKHTQSSSLAKPFRRTEEPPPSCVSSDLACRPPHDLHPPAPERACRVASPVRESVSTEVILVSSPCTDIRIPLFRGPTDMLLSRSQGTSSKHCDPGCTPTCPWSGSPGTWPYTA